MYEERVREVQYFRPRVKMAVSTPTLLAMIELLSLRMIQNVTTLIYIRAPFSDFALRAREGLELAQLDESRSELRAPIVDIRGVLDDERARSGVQGEFGIDPHQTLPGQQVDVVVVVESHG